MEATVTFNQVYEALSRVLAAYEVRARLCLDNTATLLGDMSIAVIEARLLGAVPDRERLERPFLERLRPFYTRPETKS